MIGYVKGRILDATEGKLLVSMTIGDGAIGYSVSVPQSAAYGLLAPGREIELHVYTHVREDALDLFGFASRAEKELFLTLLSVNGIGPKGALSILSGTSPEDLIHAITEGDVARLTKIPGIGKKTAERVVLELSDSLRKKLTHGGFKSATLPAGASARDESAPRPSGYLDALDALVGLGYREADASQLLKRLAADSEKPRTAEDLIKSALKELR
jgi:Holliday junction DNA helicase RuvA